MAYFNCKAKAYERGRARVREINRARREGMGDVGRGAGDEGRGTESAVEWIVLWLGHAPVRFFEHGQSSYEVVLRRDATRFGSEDQAAAAAVKNEVQEFAVVRA